MNYRANLIIISDWKNITESYIIQYSWKYRIMNDIWFIKSGEYFLLNNNSPIKNQILRPVDKKFLTQNQQKSLEDFDLQGFDFVSGPDGTAISCFTFA